MPKVILFGADWCQTCHMIKPMLQRIAEVQFVDVDEDVEIAAKYGVRSLPTYINDETGDRGTGPAKNIAELKEVLGL
ncbi:thioredoxin domain [Aeromonas phage BUCT695]|uniref:thioredoxin domain n=1 Tax=Aeromonas phage BUCT695 TaxID=2908630 RepID=UPI002329275E|nr:thioredoxin domain [Aeromonas phage BUCT695]UIW10570.1 thioredoxin-like protein [Aeromonas phage BUCT695]